MNLFPVAFRDGSDKHSGKSPPVVRRCWSPGFDRSRGTRPAKAGNPTRGWHESDCISSVFAPDVLGAYLALDKMYSAKGTGIAPTTLGAGRASFEAALREVLAVRSNYLAANK